MRNSRPIVTADSIGKTYTLTASGSQKQLTNAIWNALIRRRSVPSDIDNQDSFWAVNDVSLEIMPGESIGFIGRNGAGKTTLMKILAGIIKPDKGEVLTNGHIQSMINLASGLNANMDAESNIRNAASIRGLPFSEIDMILKDVLDFAELGTHAKSVVGTYSSGMKARLGFAICVNMKPNLLVIDEALAVGDTKFKQKCLRKLNDMRASGTAILLVSHSMGQILQFCEKTIWIENGRVAFAGESRKAIHKYEHFIESSNVKATEETQKLKKRAREDFKTGKIPNSLEELDGINRFVRNVGPFGAVILDKTLLKYVETKISEGYEITPLTDITIEVTFELLKSVASLNFGLRFYNDHGEEVSGFSSLSHEPELIKGAQKVKASIALTNIPFAPGCYHIVISINNGREKLYRNQATSFNVISTPRFLSTNVPIILDSNCKLDIK